MYVCIYIYKIKTHIKEITSTLSAFTHGLHTLAHAYINASTCYVHTYIHTYIYMHTHTHQLTSKISLHFMFIHTYIHIYTHTDINSHQRNHFHFVCLHTWLAHAYINACTCYVHTYIHTYICIHTHTSTHIKDITTFYVYTYIHTHTNTHQLTSKISLPLCQPSHMACTRMYMAPSGPEAQDTSSPPQRTSGSLPPQFS